jgi:hypothetical protein
MNKGCSSRRNSAWNADLVGIDHTSDETDVATEQSGERRAFRQPELRSYLALPRQVAAGLSFLHRAIVFSHPSGATADCTSLPLLRSGFPYTRMPRRRRQLHGLALAVCHYATRNQVYAELRKKQPDYFDGKSSNASKKRVERPTGRCHLRRRNTDAI